MENIDLKYQNEEYDSILLKIKSKKINLNDLSKYFLKKTSEDDKKKIVKYLVNIDDSLIFPNNIINNKKEYLKKIFISDFSNYIINYLIGYRELTRIMDSDDYEEIMINDYDKVFVISRRNVYYKTDILFTPETLNYFLKKVKQTLDNDFLERDFIDGMLPDNSRINIVSKKISKFNTTTIRKFLKVPLTIVDLIKNKTINYEVAVYLWLVIDGFRLYPANVFICGGTSSGKTTILNSLLHFINPKVRVIGVEDTKEINYSIFENHVSMVSNISDPDSLYNITINIMRMRPDRIIIGETRGKEAKALFMAMDTGHQGCISTIHANNSNDLVDKLKSKPMNIEDSYIKLLDVIVTVNRKVIGNKMYRFVTQISEITRMGNITLNHVYINNDLTEDIAVNFMSSIVLEKLCDKVGISKRELQVIIEKKKKVLKLIVDRNLSDVEELRDIFFDKRLEVKNILNSV
jgi:archaeal flagellar protein FlaI